MPSNAPARSRPVPSFNWSSESSHSTSHLPSPQLPYRNIEQPSESPSNHSVRPSSPFAPSDGLPTDVLAALEDIEEDDEFSVEGEELFAEAAANLAFLEEDLESDSDPDSDNHSANDSDFSIPLRSPQICPCQDFKRPRMSRTDNSISSKRLQSLCSFAKPSDPS